VKAFLKSPGGADLFENVHIEWISGHRPELVIYDDNVKEIDRVKLAYYSTEELRNLFLEKGFPLKRIESDGLNIEQRRIINDLNNLKIDEFPLGSKTKTQLLVEERVANASYFESFYEKPLIYTFSALALCLFFFITVQLLNAHCDKEFKRTIKLQGISPKLFRKRQL